MGKKTVFLLQDTNEQNERLAELISGEQDFEVVGKSTNGGLAVDEILEIKPDLVIVEIIISGGDGISVITKLKEAKINAKIVVLSAFARDEMINRASLAGADYYMAKPYNAEILIERLKEIVGVTYIGGDGKRLKDKLDDHLSTIFINVGIPPHIKGYVFLREGVKMAIEKPEIVNNITKQLYPLIGEKYNTTASKVERAIRHAIEVAWNRGRLESINGILGVRALVGKEKPTNGEFIALVADKLMVEKA